MKTITFYSYKGGVGRTLLLANVAKYLASFGQKVFALDFDLEAPGLHHKFDLSKDTRTEIDKGIVDYIHFSLQKNEKIDTLEPYTLEVENKKNTKGEIFLMPAGNVTSSSYWQSLSKINWHELFYSEEPLGVPFFLDLKARIQKEYEPDYLLIDARTGITEIGGVATTILPEYVVCLLLKNRENMEGVREVMRSINRTTRSRQQKLIEIIPVVTRLPVEEGSDQEKVIVEKVRLFLNEESSDLTNTLSISDISILHRDKDLELEESLLIESDKSIETTPLLRDYLRLISKIVPDEIIEPNLENLVKEAQDSVWHDPDKAERDLTFLAERTARPEPFEALLKFYRLRNESKTKLLRVAWKYWQVTYKYDEPILWEVIKESFDWNESETKGAFGYRYYADEKNKPYIDLNFIYRVWESQSNQKEGDFDISIEIAKASSDLEEVSKANKVFNVIKSQENLSEKKTVELLKLSKELDEIDVSFEVIDRYKSIYTSSSSFVSIWMDFIVASEDVNKATDFINNNKISIDKLIAINASSASKIYEMINKSDEFKIAFLNWIKRNISQAHSHEVIDMGMSAMKAGLFDEFETILTKNSQISGSHKKNIIEDIKRRY